MAQIHSSFEDAYPVGIVLEQYPGQKSPIELFDGSGMEWENISSQYAGCFFRAEGGSAAPFIEEGGTLTPQGYTMPAHYHRYTLEGRNANLTSAASYGNLNYTTSNVTGANTGNVATETRPTNYTIRLWKRKA